MKSAFRKDVFRQIRTSKRRFVAILLIVALGVAFFSGVRATSPDMRMTLDQYFDDYNAADVQLLSTLGFDEEDLTALREVEGMRIVQPGYAADGFLQRGDTALLVSYQSLDWQSLRDAPDTVINRPVLVEGRYPEAENECLIDAELIGDFQIGDTLTVDVKEDPDMADTLGRLEYTIVGSNEADPFSGKISNESPVGKAVVGQHIGETVEVVTPGGSRHLQITAIFQA